MKQQAKRYHDISCGHTVYGHEGKCIHLHGHNYRVHFTLEPVDDLDSLGRVLDFSVIKSVFCEWLEENWDHRFLIWEKDDRAEDLQEIDDTVILVPFNPTAENMAKHLMDVVFAQGDLFHGSEKVKLTSITIEETRKCSVTYGEA